VIAIGSCVFATWSNKRYRFARASVAVLVVITISYVITYAPSTFVLTDVWAPHCVDCQELAEKGLLEG
jgi:hypothetical protein